MKLTCIPKIFGITAIFTMATISASAFAEAEKQWIIDSRLQSLTISTGCAKPDLSKSAIEGTVVLKIYFSETGEPIKSEIKESNATEAENQTVTNALLKCTFNKNLVNAPLPKGTAKEFTYKWLPNQPLKGIALCMGFPRYPAPSIRMGEEGVAIINYRVTSDKSQYEVKITQSSGSERLDKASLAFAEQCLANDTIRRSVETDEWMEYKNNWRIDHSRDNPSSASSSQPSTP